MSRRYSVPLAVLTMFSLVFHFAPRVIEDHFNILVLAAMLTPLIILWSGTVDIKTGVFQSVVLEAVYIIYAKWYWQYRNRLMEGYFAFENPLMIDLLLIVFALSLAIAVIGKLLAGKVKRKFIVRP